MTGSSPRPSPLRYRKLWLGVGFGLIALVVYLSLTPQPVDVGEFEDVKVGHFIAYFVLMFWFAQLFRSWPARLAIAAGFALMGMGLEYAQGLTTYRSFSLTDMRDNALGVAFGWVMGSTALGATLSRVEARLGA